MYRHALIDGLRLRDCLDGRLPDLLKNRFLIFLRIGLRFVWKLVLTGNAGQGLVAWVWR